MNLELILSQTPGVLYQFDLKRTKISGMFQYQLKLTATFSSSDTQSTSQIGELTRVSSFPLSTDQVVQSFLHLAEDILVVWGFNPKYASAFNDPLWKEVTSLPPLI